MILLANAVVALVPLPSVHGTRMLKEFFPRGYCPLGQIFAPGNFGESRQRTKKLATRRAEILFWVMCCNVSPGFVLF